MKKSHTTARLALGLLNSVGMGALVAGSVCLSTSAFAQGADAAAVGGGDVEQVIVTGSRITSAGFTSPTPVTEITPVQYEAKNLDTVADIEADIPSLTPNQATSVVTDPAASNFNLRNLGAPRTLVMINGLRVGPTSVNGTVDASVLPANLISGISIVTGGASAAYGSDAVAGVVNVTFDNTLEGFKGKLGIGGTNYGDDETENAALAWGGDYDGGKGHIVLAGEYFSQLGVLQQGSRPWGRSLVETSATTGCTTITTTCTELVRLQGAVPFNISDGGNIVSAKTATGAASTALNGIMFGPAGVLQNFSLGIPMGTYDIGGSGTTQAEYMSLQPAIKRDNLYLHTTYDLTDDISVWAEGRYSRVSQFTQAATNFNQANIILGSQNAFIPAALQSMITANNITQFTISRSGFDIDPQGFDYGRYSTLGRNETRNVSGGFKGKFNALGTDWSWDVGAQYDNNYFDDQSPQEQATAGVWLLSIDSIANPAVGGVPGVAAGIPVCRSTITNPTNGCVPVNLFGPNSISAAAASYFMGTAVQQATITMFDTGANLHGEPFSTWAGPVSVATGGEYRIQREWSNNDVNSQNNIWRAGNNLNYAGHYEIEEGYLEVDTPLLKDSAIGEAADIDAAMRLTSYSTSGGVTTWKVGFNYSPTDEIRLRGTRSHDIRAPNLKELFQAGATSFGAVIIDPRTNTTANASTVVEGNPFLKPEIGDTWTGGVVYSPNWLNGFNVSLDYWTIKVTGVLTSFSAQQIVNNCYTGGNLGNACALITLNSNGLIQQIISGQINASLQKVDGFDLEGSYNFAMDDVVKGWSGTMQIHALGTYLADQIATGSLNLPVNQAGGVSTGNPRLRYNINEIWLSDPWTVSLSENFIAGGVVNQLYNPEYTTASNAQAIGAKTINNNKVDGQYTVNLSINYQLTDAWGLYASGNNIFNVDPPIVPDGLELSHAFPNQVYDRVGSFYQAGVKLRLN